MEDKDQKKPADDVSFEEENHDIDDIELDEAEGLIKDKLKKVKDELKACQKERRNELEEVQRIKADFLNSKRRNEEQLARDRERITIKHVESLLPLCDSFELAMNDPSWNTCEEKWRKGVEGIYAQLQGTLRASNVSEVGKVGEIFNPHEHEAVAHEDDGDTVTAILQKGYKMNDTIIRPARVAVG